MSIAIIGGSGALGEFVASDRIENLHRQRTAKVEPLNEDSNNNAPDVDSPLVEQLDDADQVL